MSATYEACGCVYRNGKPDRLCDKHQAEAADKFDMDAHYHVRGYDGIAFFVYGWPQKWEPCMCLCVDEETGEEYEEECGEGEWVEDKTCGQVVVVMVGDDRKHTVDLDDLTKLDELDFCHVCGQIGCAHDGLDRSEREETDE